MLINGPEGVTDESPSIGLEQCFTLVVAPFPPGVRFCVRDVGLRWLPEYNHMETSASLVGIEC
eukprot:3382951-Lingulodinium_polyedra.AAC.1